MVQVWLNSEKRNKNCGRKVVFILFFGNKSLDFFPGVIKSNLCATCFKMLKMLRGLGEGRETYYQLFT